MFEIRATDRYSTQASHDIACPVCFGKEFKLTASDGHSTTAECKRCKYILVFNADLVPVADLKAKPIFLAVSLLVAASMSAPLLGPTRELLTAGQAWLLTAILFGVSLVVGLIITFALAAQVDKASLVGAVVLGVLAAAAVVVLDWAPNIRVATSLIVAGPIALIVAASESAGTLQLPTRRLLFDTLGSIGSLGLLGGGVIWLYDAPAGARFSSMTALGLAAVVALVAGGILAGWVVGRIIRRFRARSGRA